MDYHGKSCEAHCLCPALAHHEQHVASSVEDGARGKLFSTVSVAGSNIAEQDIPTLVAAVGTAYRPNAAFVMSPATRKVHLVAFGFCWKASVHAHFGADSNSAQLPCPCLNGATTKDCLFGDFSYCYAKSMPMELRTLRERFILDGYIGLILSKRADFKWSVASTSDSPVKMLSFS